MTTDKEMAELYLARSEGKIIQFKAKDLWINESRASNLTLHLEYRIKPEPEVIYVNKREEGRYYIFNSEINAKSDTQYPEEFEYIAKRFIEAPE